MSRPYSTTAAGEAAYTAAGCHARQDTLEYLPILSCDNRQSKFSVLSQTFKAFAESTIIRQGV